jgi:hypothetical protein
MKENEQRTMVLMRIQMRVESDSMAGARTQGRVYAVIWVSASRSPGKAKINHSQVVNVERWTATALP